MIANSPAARVRSKDRIAKITLAGLAVPRLRPVPPARTKARLRELHDAARLAGVDKDLAPILASRPQVGRFIASVLDCSPFLRALILADVRRFVEVLSADPTIRLTQIVA